MIRRTCSKGMITEYGGTVIVAIAAIVLIILAFLASIVLYMTTDTPSVDFLKKNIEPYSFAIILSNFMAGDRQFLEQADEIVATGSVENASSQNLEAFMNYFFEIYGKESEKLFIVSVKDKDSKELFSVDNIPKRCGDSLEGFCLEPRAVNVRPGSSWMTYVMNIGCDPGRKIIDESLYTKEENKCSGRKICCVEDVDSSGNYNPDVTRCGKETSDGRRLGICSKYVRYCEDGRIEIDDEGNICSSAGGVCCLPMKGELLVETGHANSAEIPLLFKNEIFGTVEVTTGG